MGGGKEKGGEGRGNGDRSGEGAFKLQREGDVCRLGGTDPAQGGDTTQAPGKLRLE
jgi:hypothetical protein